MAWVLDRLESEAACDGCGYPFDEGERALFAEATGYVACSRACAADLDARELRRLPTALAAEHDRGEHDQPEPVAGCPTCAADALADLGSVDLDEHARAELALDARDAAPRGWGTV